MGNEIDYGLFRFSIINYGKANNLPEEDNTIESVINTLTKLLTDANIKFRIREEFTGLKIPKSFFVLVDFDTHMDHPQATNLKSQWGLPVILFGAKQLKTKSKIRTRSGDPVLYPFILLNTFVHEVLHFNYKLTKENHVKVYNHANEITLKFIDSVLLLYGWNYDKNTLKHALNNFFESHKKKSLNL